MKQNIKKVALAYSGGLDTSIIIPWLKDNYKCEVIAVTINVGQKDDPEKLEKKAIESGASKFYWVDAESEFIIDYVFPTLKAGAIYEGKYLLGTSMARPLQAKKQIEIALNEKADALSHGCTGKGNDQVRFELTYKSFAPNLKVIAPWREWNITTREEAIDYAEKHDIPLSGISKKNIYSRDKNIWHLSHEGGELEDTVNRPLENMFQLSISPEKAPDKVTEVEIEFDKSIPVAVNSKKLPPVQLLSLLNNLGGQNGIGRADIVETRLVGMKSRGVYETPGGTILAKALRELEMLCMDGESLNFKLELSYRYAQLVYNGKWFSPLKNALDNCIAELTKNVTGKIKLGLYKGNIIILSRQSPCSLYNEKLASFSDSEVYDQKNATGFINLYGLSTYVMSQLNDKEEEN